MSDINVTPERANDVARPEPTPEKPNWVEAVVKQAPKLTELWGSYRAFLTVITLVALGTLPFVREGGFAPMTIIVLAAMWSPLIAKKIGILD